MLLREVFTIEDKNSCKDGEYFCNDDQMCKPIPDGWEVMPDGELVQNEAVRTIWSRSGGKQVRKYRCTSGVRKGRIVARAATCNKPLNQKAKITLKKTKRRTPNRLQIRTAKTKRANPASKRLKRINVRPKKRFAGKRKMS
tara:strand:- start:1037 stop:1459 length:423 start_codon:yes stop_codon:yes gene_type:complete